ncbi:MAG: hypothetical protein ACYC2R_16405 [Burkholderiales bacterium]|nr:hypothetical protein [Sulfuricellaceae bacterium]
MKAKTNILKRLERCLADDPDHPHHAVFKALVRALCLKEKFDLATLYELPYEDFELAISIMESWRLDRYTKTKGRLRELVDLPNDE